MNAIIFGGLTGLMLGLATQAAGLTDARQLRDTVALRRLDMLRMVLAFLGFGALLTALLGWLAVLDVDLLTVYPFSGATLLGGILAGAGVWLSGLLPGTALGGVGGGKFWESLCAVAGCLIGALALPFAADWIQPLGEMAWSRATLFRVTLNAPYLLPGGFLGLGVFGFALLALAAYVPVPEAKDDIPPVEPPVPETDTEEHEFIPVLLPGMGSMMADAIDPALLDDELLALDAVEERPEEIDGDIGEDVEEPILTDHPDLDPMPEEEDMTEALVDMEERAGIGTYVSEEAMPVNARVLVKPDAEEIGAAEEEKEETREPVGKA